MSTSSTRLRARGSIALAAIALVTGCATADAPGSGTGAKAAKPASADATAAMLVFAVPAPAGATAQGGLHETFAYSEKEGDARVDDVKVTDGVARITGTVWPQKGSTWAGIGFLATPGPAGKTSDLTAQRQLRLQLASPTATQLRLRVLGDDPATRASGCYPVATVAVGAALREVAVPLSAFRPEGYCEARGKLIASVLPAVAAIEVSDPTLSGSARRTVDFSVGRIAIGP
ncbi:hypothetical protein [Piscinibacter gummiphilus]|uniref:Lipoprotein n=1 Tax=Piscinibacter gummiphilus TaxID=946333 RepID=A0ABZ0CY09_9BURK|nr:hypothetical protein [Piscinibacter gummiphilus]WOB09849.1 hypothetical protein RXV79_07220 [Piscinibacter gummiphilus]